ncbi:MAG: hypothetical protein LC117_06765 [Bacteroidia bacterium]|nr:hypothetical protein [Bacteroidia bacterium]MCZ2277613.1 hypothetical protein [Bacteroidia bacterium]
MEQDLITGEQVGFLMERDWILMEQGAILTDWDAILMEKDACLTDFGFKMMKFDEKPCFFAQGIVVESPKCGWILRVDGLGTESPTPCPFFTGLGMRPNK